MRQNVPRNLFDIGVAAVKPYAHSVQPEVKTLPPSTRIDAHHCIAMCKAIACCFIVDAKDSVRHKSRGLPVPDKNSLRHRPPLARQGWWARWQDGKALRRAIPVGRHRQAIFQRHLTAIALIADQGLLGSQLVALCGVTRSSKPNGWSGQIV